MLNFLNYIEAQKTFFRPVEKLNKMEMNKWISNFMNHPPFIMIYQRSLELLLRTLKYLTEETIGNIFPAILKRFWASNGSILPANNGQGLKCMLMMEFSILQNVLFLARIIVILIVLL